MKSDIIAAPIANLGASKKFWITFGVILWLFFVISQIPAVWGAYLATRSGDLAMSGVTGTIWSGRASLASMKIKQVDHSLGELTWKLDLASILTLKPCAKVATHMENQQFEGKVCAGFKGAFTVKDGIAVFPATLLQQMLPLAVDGQVSLMIAKLDMENNQLSSLNAKLGWMGAKVFNGSNWMSFGGFAADLQDDGKKGLKAHVFDVNSPAHVDINTVMLFPSGGSAKGSLTMPEGFFREINAGAWLAMFAIQQPNDAAGNIVYSLDTNF